jgi:hypothetical protein
MISRIVKENRKMENSPHSNRPAILSTATMLGAGSASAAQPTFGMASWPGLADGQGVPGKAV